MKKWLFIFCSFFLAGCWDVTEPERMLYILGLGIDFKDEEYIIHAEIIDFSNVAKSDQPNNPDAIHVEVGTAKGTTPSEAFYQLYQALDEQLFWGHFSYIIFSEEALKEERANMLINTVVRFHETRYNTWVYSTKDDVKEILLTTPIINKPVSLSKLADPLNSFKQDSAIEPINFRRLIIYLNEPGHNANIPLVSIYSKWETTKGKDTSHKLDGITVVSDKGYKGVIKGEDAQGLQWMNPKQIRSGLTVENGDERGNISVSVQRISPEIKTHEADGRLLFDLNITGEVNIIGFEKDLNLQEVKTILSKKIEEEVKATFLRGIELEADVYRLSEHAYRKDFKNWKKYEVDGKIPLDEDSIRSINVSITKISAGRKVFKETID